MEENVLLIAMSTLTNGVNDSSQSYLYSGEMKDEQGVVERFFFSGISQLEPGTKYFLNVLANNNRKINRIVILCTRDAENKEAGSYKGENVTALSFYKKRIKDYITGNEIDGFKPDQDVRYKELEGERFTLTELPDTVHYSEEDLDNLFLVVSNIDLVVDTSGDVYFWDAVQKIVGSEKNKINLYMDMQGGYRSVNAQINAIMSLLNARGVDVVKRIATSFQRPDPEKKKHQIQDVSEEYRTYDLVSAMTVFNKYGRGRELREYLGRNSLTDAIVKAAESISLCNVDGFEESIRKLRTEVKKRREGEQPRTQTDVVLEDIRQSFSNLWQSNPRIRYVQQIRWCLERKFVQQALTILEARMPKEYVVNGIRYYCKEGEEDSRIAAFERLYDKSADRDRYKFIDVDHYYFRGYKRNEDKHVDKLPQYTLLPRKWSGKIRENIKQYYDLCDVRNKTNHAASQTNDTEKSFTKHMKERFRNTRGCDHDRWFPNPPINEDELIATIKKYLDDFEILAKEAWANWPPEGKRPVSIS